MAIRRVTTSFNVLVTLTSSKVNLLSHLLLHSYGVFTWVESDTDTQTNKNGYYYNVQKCLHFTETETRLIHLPIHWVPNPFCLSISGTCIGLGFGQCEHTINVGYNTSVGHLCGKTSN